MRLMMILLFLIMLTRQWFSVVIHHVYSRGLHFAWLRVRVLCFLLRVLVHRQMGVVILTITKTRHLRNTLTVSCIFIIVSTA